MAVVSVSEQEETAISQSLFQTTVGFKIGLLMAMGFIITGLAGIHEAWAMGSAPWWRWAQSIGALGIGVFEAAAIAAHWRKA